MKIIILLAVFVYLAGFVIRARQLGAAMVRGAGPRTTKWNELWEKYPNADDVPRWKKLDLADRRWTANIHLYFWPIERGLKFPVWLWKNFFGRFPELLAPTPEPAPTASEEEPVKDGRYR